MDRSNITGATGCGNAEQSKGETMSDGTPQSIVVTGASSGFGRLIVETLARRGHNVFAGLRDSAGKNARVAQELRALAATDGLDLRPLDLDVTDDASVERAMAKVIDAAGRLDVVVNNAGVAYTGPIEAFTVEQAQQQFDTNVFGVLRLNRAALLHMRGRGAGLLLQVGSVVGRVAFPFTGLYGATKFALEGLTESYRYELAPLGIDAVIVEPGTYPTRIGENRTDPADAARVAAYLPAMGVFMERFFADMAAAPPDPQEVADAVARLIETPVGARPLRTVVALENQAAPTRAANEAADRAERAYLDMLGVTGMLTLAPAKPRNG